MDLSTRVSLSPNVSIAVSSVRDPMSLHERYVSVAREPLATNAASSGEHTILPIELEVYPGFLESLREPTTFGELCARAETFGRDSLSVKTATLRLFVHGLAELTRPTNAVPTIQVIGDRESVALFTREMSGPLCCEPVDGVGELAKDRPVLVLRRELSTNHLAGLLELGAPLLYVSATPTCWLIGPSTYPGQTACLGCLVSTLSVGSPMLLPTNELTRNHIRLIPYLATVIEAELARLSAGEVTSLINRALRIPLTAAPSNPLRFAPSALCDGCSRVRPHAAVSVAATALSGTGPVSSPPPNRSFEQAIAIAEGALAKLDIEYADWLERPSHGVSPSVIPENVFIESLAFRQRRRYPVAPATTEFMFGSGAGFSKAHARCGALYEYFEHLFSRYRASIPVRVATPAEILKEGGFDLLQYLGEPSVVPPGGRALQAHDRVHWVEGCSVFDGGPRWIPASLVFRGNAYEQGGITTDAESYGIRGGYAAWSGCAAGSSRQDAVVSGLLEVVERYDATCALRTGEPMPAILLEEIDDDALKEVLAWLKRQNYTIVMRDLTGELGIPVVECGLRHPTDTSRFLLSGHAAHFDAATAVRKALFEALQYVCWATFRPYGAVSSHHGSYLLFERSIKRTDGTRRIADIGTVPTDWQSDPHGTIVRTFREHGMNPSAYVYPGAEELGLSVVNILDEGVPDSWGKMWGIPRRLKYFRRSPDHPRTLADIYMGGICELGLD